VPARVRGASFVNEDTRVPGSPDSMSKRASRARGALNAGFSSVGNKTCGFQFTSMRELTVKHMHNETILESHVQQTYNAQPAVSIDGTSSE
jgi:hypothetical protein